MMVWGLRRRGASATRQRGRVSGRYDAPGSISADHDEGEMAAAIRKRSRSRWALRRRARGRQPLGIAVGGDWLFSTDAPPSSSPPSYYTYMGIRWVGSAAAPRENGEGAGGQTRPQQARGGHPPPGPILHWWFRRRNAMRGSEQPRPRRCWCGTSSDRSTAPPTLRPPALRGGRGFRPGRVVPPSPAWFTRRTIGYATSPSAGAGMTRN